MKGLELARQYYEHAGRPAIEAAFPAYAGRIAAGLCGEGSQCFGFDDAISQDHDFTPGFCLWLDRQTYAEIGDPLRRLYTSLPEEYEGCSVKNVTPEGAGRLGVFEIGDFYQRLCGCRDIPRDYRTWFFLKSEYLAEAVNGAVFSDPGGEFTRIRNGLAAGYPEPVRLKKLSAGLAVMAQSGQYNYARCMRRGELTAAVLAQAEFTRSALRVCHLLNHRYCPYDKWACRSLSQLPRLSEVSGLLTQLSGSSSQRSEWDPSDPAQYAYRLNTADQKVVLIEEICDRVLRELRRQGLTEGRESFLLAHVPAVLDRVEDDYLKSLPQMEG